ncbi:MAG: hypothetical protein R2771_09875 [Saprospiraceae bacterium]
MKQLVFILMVFIFYNKCSAQDTITLLNINEESKIFYLKLYKKLDDFIGNKNLEFYKKNGHPIPPEQHNLIVNEFYKLQRDSLQETISQKSQCKTELIDSLIEYRLQLWNYRKGGQIPDSTFLLLINSYYDIDQKGAYRFLYAKLEYS